MKVPLPTISYDVKQEQHLRVIQPIIVYKYVGAGNGRSVLALKPGTDVTRAICGPNKITFALFFKSSRLVNLSLLCFISLDPLKNCYALMNSKEL